MRNRWLCKNQGVWVRNWVHNYFKYILCSLPPPSGSLRRLLQSLTFESFYSEHLLLPSTVPPSPALHAWSCLRELASSSRKNRDLIHLWAYQTGKHSACGYRDALDCMVMSSLSLLPAVIWNHWLTNWAFRFQVFVLCTSSDYKNGAIESEWAS